MGKEKWKKVNGEGKWRFRRGEKEKLGSKREESGILVSDESFSIGN